MDWSRKLLVEGVNALLDQKLISLDDVKEENERSSHYAPAEIGGRPSLVLWRGIGHEELRIAVWWDFDKDRYEQIMKGYEGRYNSADPLVPKRLRSQVVGATSAGWLERRNGKWLQGRGRGGILWRYLRAGSKAIIDALPNPQPQGFSAEGKFIP